MSLQQYDNRKEQSQIDNNKQSELILNAGTDEINHRDNIPVTYDTTCNHINMILSC